MRRQPPWTCVVLAMGLLAGCRTSVRAGLPPTADMTTMRPTMHWSAGPGTPTAQGQAGITLVETGDHGALLAFGGTPLSSNDVWSFSLADDTWSKLRLASSAPPARAGLCAAYLPTTNQVLLVGGHDDRGDVMPASMVFAVTGASFAPMQGGPPPESGCAAAFMPKLGQAVVLDASAHTWVFDAQRQQFRPLSTSHAPSMRHDASVAYDPGNDAGGGRVLLFGGSTDGAESAELWAFDGTDWAELGTSSDPAADTTDEPRPLSRARAAMAIDSSRRLLYLFGGVRMGVFLNDLWRLDLRSSTWEKLSAGPTGRADAAVAYDVTRDRLLLFGGTGNRGPLADGWRLAATDAQ